MRIRQPIFCHHFHKRLDMEGLTNNTGAAISAFSSRDTYSVTMCDGDNYHTGDLSQTDDESITEPVSWEHQRSSHHKFLRSSCSLPLASASELRCATSVRMVERRLYPWPSLYVPATCLPQFKPGSFKYMNAMHLMSEDMERLGLLLDTAVSSVRHPTVFRHLLTGECRVLLDPVSSNMEAPQVQAVRWRSSVDTMSLASSSTATSLNTSLASIGTTSEEAEGTLVEVGAPFHSTVTSPQLWEMSVENKYFTQWKRLLVEQLRGNGELGHRCGSGVRWISRETRQSVVIWMSKVIEAMGWPLNSFFTAVHAMDYSLGKSELDERHRSITLPEHSVPLLSTACVLIGVSAECEHRQMQKARAFVGQVPHVASVKEIICKQLAVVAGLDRGTLLHKTPLDFVLYYLAALRLHSNEIEHHRLSVRSTAEHSSVSLWEKLINFCVPRHRKVYSGEKTTSFLQYVLHLSCTDKNYRNRASTDSVTLLEIIVDGILVITISCYMEFVHTFLPLSRVVAAVMFLMLTIVEDSFKDVDFCVGFVRRVYAIDYVADLVPVLADLLPLLCDLVTRRFATPPLSPNKLSCDNQSECVSTAASMSNESAFTTCSISGRILLRRLEEIVKLGFTAIPHI